jgi:glc operon protein GlcG
MTVAGRFSSSEWTIRLTRPVSSLPRKKARSAALFKKPTAALEHAIDQGRIAAVTARGFIEMQGGLPIMVDGQVIAGIGASFDTPEHDVKIAQAGLAALKH